MLLKLTWNVQMTSITGKQDSAKEDIVNKVDIHEKNQNKDKVPKVRSCNVALTNVQCSD